MKIVNIDHLVLTVESIEKSVQFYTSVLGFKELTFDGSRTALTFGEQKINLHQLRKEYEPKADKPTPGSADLCFFAETDLPVVIDELKLKNVEIVEGIVERNGAKGKIVSVYIRDPDKNLIEICNYI